MQISLQNGDLLHFTSIATHFSRVIIYNFAIKESSEILRQCRGITAVFPMWPVGNNIAKIGLFRA